MPDFDANEDATLPGRGQGETPAPSEQGPPAVPRARELPDGHLDAAERAGIGRLRPSVLSHRRRAARRACNRDCHASELRSLHRRRRLWTLCHGRRPGFPS
ncbi:MAG TPA: hypothetical protein VGW98_08515 [Solirubrobacteraceae bacterium]|jgi:hypothetical protein|nr:hypothetical protein [Solirubrobacteraceae bacterium]